MARVTISPRMPVGPQGAAAPEVQVQYSSDGTNWHDTPQSGDMYLRFSTDGGDTWGESIRLAEMAIDDQITDGVTDRAPSQNAVYDALQALVEDQITDGVTDKAPSQNAVYDALQNYVLLSDYEDADVLAKVKNLDGENSGLDADLVRGLPADFTSSKATNGYQKLPSGLIIQWGLENSGASGTATITFPIVFPNQCLVLIGTIFYNSADQNRTVQVLTVSTEQATIYKAYDDTSASSSDAFWIAIGY